MADIPDTGNIVNDIQDAVYDYYETPAHSISSRRAKSGSLSPNFVMFQPKFSGTLTSWSRSGRKKKTHIREGEYNAIYERLKNNPDHFVLTVGVLDENQTHYNVFGYDNISYGLLFDCLKNIGYDPLWPIRKEDFISKIERRMGDSLLKEFSKKNYTSLKGRNVIESIGREIVLFVKDFISAGRKPFLAQRTIITRNWKDDNYPGLYRNGIDEPLSESGQLEDAITFDVECYESEDKEKYEKKKEAIRRRAERVRKQKRKKTREEAKRRRRIEAISKAIKKGKTIPKSIVDEKVEELQKYNDELYEKETQIANLESAIKHGEIDENYIYRERTWLIVLKNEANKYIELIKKISSDYGIPIEGF